MRRDVYFNCWDVLFLSGGHHLENEMYVSTGEMYIFKYISPVEINIFPLEIYISLSKWRPPDTKWRSPDMPDISDDRHLQNEMFILSEKMYIFNW